ncbi:hypothetical protein TSOC_010874 [Tetrabaena socialis]|uniref:PAS domain-containing protein n=1 Tax=Tetrabaena socialis TaxID=47790 RepID=A0A2J7ZS41_9CHLO|nr:hypothetical protein TSOC_010874 [Tetrabaena socialis]|eukprot:PNH03085.1 hypothetical protein TSOC_010874 [Tetrabaena socialis]
MALGHSGAEVTAFAIKAVITLADVFLGWRRVAAVVYLLLTLGLAWQYLRWAPHLVRWVNYLKTGMAAAVAYAAASLCLLVFSPGYDVEIVARDVQGVTQAGSRQVEASQTAAGNHSGGATMDLLGYVEYQRKVRSVVRLHREALQAMCNFWKLLDASSVSFTGLSKALGKIESSVSQAQALYRVVLEQYASSPGLVRLYGKFLEKIKNDPWGAAMYYAEAERLEELKDTDGGGPLLPNGTPLGRMDELAVAVFVLTSDGSIQMANKQSHSMLGVKRGMLEGKGVTSILAPQYAQRIMDLLAALVSVSEVALPGTNAARALGGVGLGLAAPAGGRSVPGVELDSEAGVAQTSVLLLLRERLALPATLTVSRATGVGEDSTFIALVELAPPHSDSASMWVTANGVVATCDQAFCSHLGFHPADVIGASIGNLLALAPDSVEAAAATAAATTAAQLAGAADEPPGKGRLKLLGGGNRAKLARLAGPPSLLGILLAHSKLTDAEDGPATRLLPCLVMHKYEAGPLACAVSMPDDGTTDVLIHEVRIQLATTDRQHLLLIANRKGAIKYASPGVASALLETGGSEQRGGPRVSGFGAALHNLQGEEGARVAGSLQALDAFSLHDFLPSLCRAQHVKYLKLQTGALDGPTLELRSISGQPLYARTAVYSKDLGGETLHFVRLDWSSLGAALAERRLRLTVSPDCTIADISRATPPQLLGFDPAMLAGRLLWDVVQEDAAGGIRGATARLAFMQVHAICIEGTSAKGSGPSLFVDLWPAEAVTGVLELGPSGHVKAVAEGSTRPAGLLFGLPSEKLVGEAIGKFVMLPPGRDAASLLSLYGTAKKSSMKTNAKGQGMSIKVGPVHVLPGRHADGGPLALEVQVVGRPDPGQPLTVLIRCHPLPLVVKTSAPSVDDSALLQADDPPPLGGRTLPGTAPSRGGMLPLASKLPPRPSSGGSGAGLLDSACIDGDPGSPRLLVPAAAKLQPSRSSATLAATPATPPLAPMDLDAAPAKAAPRISRIGTGSSLGGGGRPQGARARGGRPAEAAADAGSRLADASLAELGAAITTATDISLMELMLTAPDPIAVLDSAAVDDDAASVPDDKGSDEVDSAASSTHDEGPGKASAAPAGQERISTWVASSGRYFQNTEAKENGGPGLVGARRPLSAGSADEETPLMPSRYANANDHFDTERTAAAAGAAGFRDPGYAAAMEDDAASEGGYSAVSSQAGGGGVEYKRGKRFKKLVKLMDSSTAQHAVRRLKLHVFVVLTILAVVRTAFFATAVSSITEKRATMLSLANAGRAQLYMKRALFASRAMDRIYKGQTLETLYTRADLPRFAESMITDAEKAQDTMSRIVKAASERNTYGIQDLFFYQTIVAIDVLLEEAVISAREVSSLQLAFLVTEGVVVTVIAAGYVAFLLRTVAFQRYKLYGTFTIIPDTGLDEEDADDEDGEGDDEERNQGEGSDGEGRRVAVGKPSKKRSAAFDAKPGGSKGDDSFVAGADGIVGSRTAARSRRRSSLVIIDVPPPLEGTDKAAASTPQLAPTGHKTGCWSAVARLFTRRGPSVKPLLSTGTTGRGPPAAAADASSSRRRSLKNDSYDTAIMLTPFLVWSTVVIVLYAVAVIQMQAIVNAVAVHGITNIYVFRCYRLAFFAQELMSETNPALLPLRRANLADSVREGREGFFTIKMGNKAALALGNATEIFPRVVEGIAYSSPRITDLLFFTHSCLRLGDHLPCPGPSYRYYEITHLGVDVLLQEYLHTAANLALGNATTPPDISDPNFDMIYNTGTKDLVGGNIQIGEAHYELIVAVFAGLLRLHIILFLSLFLVFAVFTFLLLFPLLKRVAREKQRIAELMSQLPLELDVEKLMNRALGEGSTANLQVATVPLPGAGGRMSGAGAAVEGTPAGCSGVLQLQPCPPLRLAVVYQLIQKHVLIDFADSRLFRVEYTHMVYSPDYPDGRSSGGLGPTSLGAK